MPKFMVGDRVRLRGERVCGEVTRTAFVFEWNGVPHFDYEVEIDEEFASEFASGWYEEDLLVHEYDDDCEE